MQVYPDVLAVWAVSRSSHILGLIVLSSVTATMAAAG